MTLVLPYGPDQIGNTYSGGVRTSSSMPCVFDGEPLDFESALMTEWNSEINVYESSTDDFSTKSPSDGIELKRKLTNHSDSQLQLPQSKKQRTEEQQAIDPLANPLIVSSSSSSSSSSCSSSSSSSSSSEGQEDDASSTPDEEEYIPRRRGPQMWNSRQRWKDERKRVLKLSMSKMAEIEDPELYMHKSVVINNTIKRLHTDIKNERQAKLKQRQQRMDLFNERFEQRLGIFREDNKSSVTVESFDDSSCDEMFGISEDFLRVTIPDRRAPTPIPQSVPHSLNCSEEQEDSRMDTSENQTAGFNSATTSSSCDKHATDSASLVRLSDAAANTTTTTTTITCNSSTAANNTISNSRRLVSNSGPQQCATQYRTSRDAGSSTSFPPRVPILDSVVYHSLLASLEH